MINRTHSIKYIVLTVILIMLAQLVQAQDNNSAAAYIRMGIGARTIAMGEAGTASTMDVTSAYWNPAGLHNMKDVEFSSMYALNMGYDRSYKYAAIGKRYEFGSLALNWINASVDDIAGYDDNDQPTGFFGYNEHNIALSYANSWKRIQYGITPKFYLSSMDDEVKTGAGFDLGLRYDINQYLVAGLMARDLYAKVGSDKVPYEISMGLSAFPFIGINLAADLKLEEKEGFSYAFGAEYWTSIGKDPEADSKLSVVEIAERNTWSSVFGSAQTGIRLGFNDSRLSVGTGLKLSNLQLDYVYRINNHEIFNDDHMLSLIIRY